MAVKPLGDRVWVELSEDQAQLDAPGLLAEVLAVGPDFKGAKPGDAVYLSRYYSADANPSAPGTVQSVKGRKILVSQYEVLAREA